MKNIYLLLFALMISGLGFGQTTIYTQDFETVDDGYTASGTEGSGFTDVFNRTNPNVGGNSSFIWSIEDTNLTSPTITLDQIDVTGYADFTFSLDMLAHHYNDWDNADELLITYSIDSGTTQNLLWVQNAGATFNQAASLDTDCDGDCGAGILPAITTGNSGCNVTSSNFATFSSSTITLSSNTTLDIVLTFNGFTSGDEGMYLDNIEVEGNLAGGGCTAPTTQATAYNTTSIGTSSATLNWTSGDGDEVLVLVKETSAVDTDPTDGTSYTGNTAFGSGTEIGTGNYAVQYGSAASSVGITGLNPSTIYHVAVYEYNTTDTCYLTPALTGSFTTSAVTTVQFSTTSVSVAEDSGTYNLVIEIADEDTAATTFDVVLTSGDNTDIDTYTTQSESFLGSSSTDIMVTVTITDDAIVEADEVFIFEIQSVAGGNSAEVGTNNSFDLTILANDAPPPTDGWQITSEDTSFVIDFDTTVSDVNEGAFDGSGFTTSPATGQLDSDAWESTGLSDGALNYGGSETSGDYARGTSSGGVTSGGFYSFDTGGSNNTLGTQGTGSDFTPGTITLRAQNQTGVTVTAADLAYLVYVYNDQGRSSTFDFSYSTDDSSYTDVIALDLTTDATADGSPTWVSNSKSTNITGLSIADGDYLYLRWSSADVGGSGSRDEIALDDIDLKFNPAVPTTYTFNGTWSPSDPNGAAAADEFIVIASGNATIDTNTTCDNVTVNAGAGLTIDTGITLTTSNGVAMESTSTTYSSLILDGTIAGAGAITYERHVNVNGSGETGSNDLISAPLTGQAFDDFVLANSNILNNGTLYLFGPFDKTTAEYITYAGTATNTLDAGVGYRAASSDNSTFTFTGTANNSDVIINITNGGPSEPEWNLIGNPYPSYINVQDFLNHDVDDTATTVTNLQLFNAGTAAIYGYDGNALDGWIIYNLATTTASTLIAPGQGFFVSADATNEPLYDLEFTPAMRSTGTTDDFIVGRNAQLVYVKVNASTNNKSHTTDFYFNNSASQGFDLGYDAEVWGGSTPDFAIYSHLAENNQGDAMALQALNTADLSNTIIPLGVNANQGEQLTFSIAESTLPESANVYLDDVVANTSTLLNNNDYVFTPTTDLSGTGRFFLRTSQEILSTIENSLDALNIFALNNSKELVVSGQLQENSNLELYDIQGRKVLSTQLDPTTIENRVDVSILSGGIYLITVENNGQQKTQKVILK